MWWAATVGSVPWSRRTCTTPRPTAGGCSSTCRRGARRPGPGPSMASSTWWAARRTPRSRSIRPTRPEQHTARPSIDRGHAERLGYSPRRFCRAGCLLLERSVHQEIHGRRPLVAWHETLPEVPREIVVGGLRLGFDNAADRIGEAPLHIEAGKCGEDALHLVRRDPVVLESEFDADPGRAERHFSLFIQADRRGGIQSDAVPDQLYAAIVETLLARERLRCIGSFYLEALWTREAVREPKVVE